MISYLNKYRIDCNKRPEKTMFIILKKDGNNEFDKDQLKSLKAVGEMVEKNEGKVFDNLESAAT